MVSEYLYFWIGFETSKMFIHPQTVAKLCSNSCKKIISAKYLPFAGRACDLTPFGLSRNYSSIIQNDTLSYNNPLKFKQNVLPPVFACRGIGDTKNLQSFTSAVTFNKNTVREFLKNKFRRSKYGKATLTRSGYLLYEDITHNTDALHFFKVLSLEDTLFSWFLVMELQLWLVAARLGAEEEDGKMVRDGLISAFWEDVPVKIKMLGERPTNKNRQVEELNSHFRTSLVGYDEGLLSCDRTLACAVWRNIIRRETGDSYYEDDEDSIDDSNKSSLQSSVDESKVNLDDIILKPKADPRVLEAVVCYIRKQMYLLDQVSREDLLLKGKVTWTKLDDIS